MQTGKERQTNIQSPVQRGLSHPRRSARPSDRAQTRSRTPSSPGTSQQRQPSRARLLSVIQVNTVAPGTLQAPPFSRRLHQPHRREELARRRNTWWVTQGVPHAECACASACMCLRAYLPPQPQRWLRLLVLPLGRSGPPAGTRAIANAREARRRAVRSGTAEPVVLLFWQLAVSPFSVVGLVNHDCSGRQS